MCTLIENIEMKNIERTDHRDAIDADAQVVEAVVRYLVNQVVESSSKVSHTTLSMIFEKLSAVVLSAVTCFY